MVDYLFPTRKLVKGGDIEAPFSHSTKLFLMSQWFKRTVAPLLEIHGNIDLDFSNPLFQNSTLLAQLSYQFPHSKQQNMLNIICYVHCCETSVLNLEEITKTASACISTHRKVHNVHDKKPQLWYATGKVK